MKEKFEVKLVSVHSSALERHKNTISSKYQIDEKRRIEMQAERK